MLESLPDLPAAHWMDTNLSSILNRILCSFKTLKCSLKWLVTHLSRFIREERASNCSLVFLLPPKVLRLAHVFSVKQGNRPSSCNFLGRQRSLKTKYIYQYQLKLICFSLIAKTVYMSECTLLLKVVFLPGVLPCCFECNRGNVYIV